MSANCGSGLRHSGKPDGSRMIRTAIATRRQLPCERCWTLRRRHRPKCIRFPPARQTSRCLKPSSRVSPTPVVRVKRPPALRKRRSVQLSNPSRAYRRPTLAAPPQRTPTGNSKGARPSRRSVTQDTVTSDTRRPRHRQLGRMTRPAASPRRLLQPTQQSPIMLSNTPQLKTRAKPENQLPPNCPRERTIRRARALTPRLHKSGRPGSNRRRPAWESVSECRQDADRTGISGT
jgi:hypothetical protein